MQFHFQVLCLRRLCLFQATVQICKAIFVVQNIYREVFWDLFCTSSNTLSWNMISCSSRHKRSEKLHRLFAIEHCLLSCVYQLLRNHHHMKINIRQVYYRLGYQLLSLLSFTLPPYHPTWSQAFLGIGHVASQLLCNVIYFLYVTVHHFTHSTSLAHNNMQFKRSQITK